MVSRLGSGSPVEVFEQMSSRPQAPVNRATLEKLQPARDGLEREQVREIQRARLLVAMTEVVCERGAAHATVARVVERAGVSRRTFYELFDDREDCFLAAFEEWIADASRYVRVSCDPGAKWADRLRGALVGLLSFLEMERGGGRLLVDGSLGAGPRALERRRRVLARMIAVVDEGRGEAKNGVGLPPLTAEGIVGGVFSVIHSRLMQEGGTEDGGTSLVELANPLMAMIVLPYLGPAAVRKELARPVPPAPNGVRRTASDPLRDLDIRLTYRTVRVLLAIGALGGGGSCPSNRQVADHSGIRDQGQISKLLARLEHLGLICNAGDARTKGEPNAWALTDKGAEVRTVISGHGPQP